MKYFKGSKKARESLRRKWVDDMAQRLFARHAAPYELEKFGKHVWDVCWDIAVEWAINHHPEVKELEEELKDMYERLDALEKD